ISTRSQSFVCESGQTGLSSFGAGSPRPSDGSDSPLAAVPHYWQDRSQRPQHSGGSRMTIHSPLRFGRRTFVGSGLAWVVSSVSARAQSVGRDAGRPTAGGGAASGSTRMDADKLKALIALALAEPDETPLSRPAILGLGADPLKTKSI